MLTRFLTKKKVALIPEDLEDVLKLKLIVNNSEVHVKRIYYVEDIYQEKVKRKKERKIVVEKLSNVKFESKKYSVFYLLGRDPKNHMKKIVIHPSMELLIEKKFTYEEELYLHSLKKKTILYFAVEPGTILIGELTQKSFKEVSKKYFNFKTEGVLEPLKKVLPKEPPNEAIFKCSKVFLNELNQNTPHTWTELKGDAELAWTLDSLSYKKETLLIEDFLKNLKNHTSCLKEALEAIFSQNLKTFYIASNVNSQDYHTLFEALSENDIKKVKLITWSERISHLIPNGFLLIRYF